MSAVAAGRPREGRACSPWDVVPQRHEVLRDVIKCANSNPGNELPMHLPGVEQTFGDELTLLEALGLLWHTRLARGLEGAVVAGRVDRREPESAQRAVAAVWCETADALPGVRATLDRYRRAPLDDAMAAAMAAQATRDHALLAQSAGSPGENPASVATGAQIEQAAREEWRPASSSLIGYIPLLHRLRKVWPQSAA